MRISGLVFDKDGTLFDFQATWGVWSARVIAALTGGDPAGESRLAAALGFDLAARRFLPSSPVIAGTTADIVDAIAPVLGRQDRAALAAELNVQSTHTPQVPAVDLPACLSGLRGRGLRLGLVTNDAEFAARRHLEDAQVLPLFDFVAGYDSGFGAKPDPGQLLAFAERVGLPAHEIAMVGDSTHDLKAAQAAGMHPVGVLTGPAPRAELAPLAEVVLDDIGGLAGWLDLGAAKGDRE